MSADDLSERAIELLSAEAWSFYQQGRFAEALRTAERAREGAQRLGSLRLEIHATRIEAAALDVLGDKATALARYSWILGVAQDSAHRAELVRAGVELELAEAYMRWVAAARFLPEMPAEPLLAVLDAGEAYVRGIGKPGWRAGLLFQRAQVLADLGRVDAAITLAQEGLALQEREPTALGTSLEGHRWGLGDLLRRADRYADAAQCYESLLADDRSSSHGRFAAHRGLARCALAAGDPATARRHAEEAVRLAEGMGDDALVPALEALSDACLALKDLPSARVAADRMLEGARRLGSNNRLYFALRNAARVALTEKDAPRAYALLNEAQPYAEALDRSRNETGFTGEIARFRAQADELPPSSNRP